MQKTNGFAWEQTLLMPSAEHTEEANEAGDTFDLGDWCHMVATLDITDSATDAGDVLDVFLDVSYDGAVWFNAVHFTQQAGNGSAKKEVAVLHPAQPDASAPDDVVIITGDAASGKIRPMLGAPLVRVRSTVVRVTGVDEAHTFSVFAYTR